MSPADAQTASKLVDAVREIEEFLELDHNTLTARYGKNVQFVAGFRGAGMAQAAFMLPLDLAKEQMQLMAVTMRAKLSDLGVD